MSFRKESWASGNQNLTRTKNYTGMKQGLNKDCTGIKHELNMN